MVASVCAIFSVAFDTIGELMKSLFCRPYGTDPDVYMSLIPAVNYWAIINNPYGIKKA